MFRNSDLWILLALAAFVSWRHKDDVESALNAAAVALRPFMPQVEAVEIRDYGTAIADNAEPSRPQLGGRQILYRTEPFGPMCDCSQVPPGCMIIHDAGCRPMWGQTFDCREY